MKIEIFLDIETLPTSRKDIQERAASDVAPPANYKSPEAIAKWWLETGNAKKNEAASMTALDGTWGEVLCIGLAINDDPVKVMCRALAEPDLLREFSNILEIRCEGLLHSGAMWEPSATYIGHNIQDFDLRFLWQRSRICGVRFPFQLPIGKPNYNRGPYVYDTMREWCGLDRQKRIKQTDLELAFGIERNDSITGAGVFAAYQTGEMDKIINHCKQDVENLRAIYRRMTA